MRFILITRCYKPTNIETIRQNIKQVFADTQHSYLHILVVDASHGVPSEAFSKYADPYTKVYYLNKVKQDTQNTRGIDHALQFESGHAYVFILDDDNLLHPDFLKIADSCTDDAVVFKIEGRESLGNRSIMQQDPVGRIDWANFVTRLDVMKRLKAQNDGICEDGIFFRKLKSNNCSIRFLDDVAAYYNKLPKP